MEYFPRNVFLVQTNELVLMNEYAAILCQRCLCGPIKHTRSGVPLLCMHIYRVPTDRELSSDPAPPHPLPAGMDPVPLSVTVVGIEGNFSAVNVSWQLRPSVVHYHLRHRRSSDTTAAYTDTEVDAPRNFAVITGKAALCLPCVM